MSAFEKLLWLCCQSDTTISGVGHSATIERLPGEIILAFHTDSTPFKRAFDHEGKGKFTCDGLLFYRRSTTDDPILAFVELKGGTKGHGYEQLRATIGIVRPLVEREIPKRTRYAAVLLATSGAPRKHTERQKQFHADGVDLVIKTLPKGKTALLRDLLFATFGPEAVNRG
jgi:hypothetical protein